MATISSPRPTSPGRSLTSPPPPGTPSVTGTPTSSVRPSIDLPSQSISNPPSTRRNRTALRDYYNLKSRPSAPAQHSAHSRTNSLTSNISEPPDHQTSLSSLDDPAFDPDAYIAQFVATCGLRDILKTESTLASEIRTLDGERKALVYDNYSKLIKAVGTIGDLQRGMMAENQGQGLSVLGMKKEAKGLKDIEQLTNKMEKLVGFVNGFQGSEEQREMVGEKRRRKGLERKKEVVRWVVRAPQRLSSMLMAGKTEEAEQEWTEVQKLLVRWEGVKGVEKVKERCEATMQKEKEDASKNEDEHDTD